MKRILIAITFLVFSGEIRSQSGSNIFPSDTIKACGANYTLSAPSGLTGYLWSTGATSQSITTNRTGWYSVSALQNGTRISDSVFLNLLYVNIINNDTSICPGNSVVLNAQTAFNFSCTGYPAQQYSTWTSIGPLGVIYKWNNTYYIRTLTDVLQSPNLNGPWTSMGFFAQTGIFGPAELLGVDATGRLHVGTTNNGLYVYNNGTWTSTGLSGAGTASQFFTLLPNGRIIISRTGSAAGVYYSDDNGNTWIQANAPPITWFYFTVANDGTIFAVGSQGVIRSTDNGTNWTVINSQFGNISSATGISKDCNGTLWLVADRMFYRSTDNGITWVPVLPIPGLFTSNPTGGVLLAASNGEIYYYGFISPLTQGLFVTRDGGQSWTPVTGFPGLLSYLKEIDGQLIACTNQGVYALTLQPLVTLQWSTGATTSSITVSPNQSTTYYVTATNGVTVCRDSVRINVGAVFAQLFPGDTIYHCGSSVNVSAPAGYSSYQWNNGASTRTITVTDPGLYYVQAQPSLGCPVFDSVYVNILNINILNSDTAICPGDSVELSVDPGQGLRISCFDPTVVKGGNSINGYHGVALDGAKNYFLGGTFSGNAAIGGFPVTSVGGQDIFLAKYDSCGNPLWVITGGSTSTGDDAGSVDTDASGNVYFTGRYNQPMTLTGTGGTSFNAAYTPSGNAGHQDGFVVKISPTGRILWGATIQGGSNDGFSHVTVDNNDCPIVTGGFNGCCPSTFAATIYGPNGSVGVNSFGSNYGTGVMVKFDPAGNILWRATIHNRDVGMDRTAVDAANNIYVVGAFRSWNMGTPAQFIDGTGANNTIFNPGIGLAFLVKLNANGIWQWGVSMGNQGDGVGSLTGASDVRVDASGNPWVCGTYSGAAITFYSTSGATITQPASVSNRGYLVRYSTAGVPLSSISHQQSTGATVFTGLSVTAGSVAVTGYYSGGNQGGNDALLLMYDLSGQLMQTAVPGGGGEDYLSSIDWNGSNYVVAGATSSMLVNVDGVNLNGSCNFLWNASSFGMSANTILWSTGDSTATITVHPTATTTYYVTVSNGYHSCRDSVKITVNNLNSNLFTQDTVSVCGTSYTITVPSGYSSYQWNTGSAGSSIVTTATGWYSCTVFQGACPITDSIFISIINSDIINNDTIICPLNSDSLLLSVLATGNRPSQSCTGLPLFNYDNWTSIAPAGSYVNIFRDGSGYFLRSSTDVLQSSNLNGPWLSMNFTSQIGNNCSGSMLGKDWAGKLLVSTCHNSLYGFNNGTWIDMGLGGFGCSGNFMSRLSNGRIIVEKNGFLRDLYISDNDGASWTNVTNVDNDYFDMILSPNGNIYVCGGSNTPSMTGLIKSIDNGNSFSQINAQLGISYCSGFSKDCAGAIYAVADNKIFKSIDGNTWNLQCLIPSFFTVNPGYSYMVVASNGDYYLWSYSGPGMCGFFKSTNQGATWTQISNFPTAPTQITRLKEIDGHIVATTGQGVFAQSIQSGISILWSTGDTSRSIRVAPTQTTTYYCTVSNGITSCTDSVKITVNQPTTSITSLSSCDSLRWNGTLYTSSGNYSFLTTNSKGCDSTANMNLTINPSTHNVIFQSVCDTFRWNGNLYSQSGNYVKNYFNAAGCPSADTLILTIIPVNTTVNVNDTSFCAGNTVTITAQTNPAGNYNYSWTVPAGATNPGNQSSVTTAVPGLYSVYATPVSNLLCNSDFEDNQLVAPGNWTLTNQANVPCWQTSANDQQIEVWGTGYNGTPAYSGNQFIELNANMVSTLYQDFSGVAGTPVTVSFAHRGRAGADVMGVEIGPAGGPYTSLGSFTDGNTAWGYHTVNFTLPPSPSGNYSLRFVSISAAGGNIAIGNFLDAITVTMTTCPSRPDSCLVTINQPSSSLTTLSSCDSLRWNGTLYTSSGNYNFLTTNSKGCDSTANLALTIFNGTFSGISQSACDSFRWNGSLYTASGIYVRDYNNQNGCASKDTLYLTVNRGTFTSDIQSVCDSIRWYGTLYTSSGIYVHPYNNINGCISADTLHLTVNRGTFTSVSQIVCDSLRWNGTLYTSSGTYVHNYSNINGCASADTLYLTVFYNTPAATTISSCVPYTWNGVTYTQSGNYPYSYSNGPCTITDTLHLTINIGTFNAETTAACNSYFWNGSTYTTSGNYLYNYTNSFGCSSTDTLHLTINTPTHNSQTETTCGSFIWQGSTYGSSGTYLYNYTNSSGCQSTDTLHLTVNSGTFNKQTEVSCVNFSWNGSTYTTSGIYVYPYTNGAGCPSADTLDLTIHNGTFNTETTASCNSYFWNGTNYYATGNYLYNYLNSFGCQSADTLHLTINTGTFTMQAQSACQSFTWNGSTYSTSGIYVYNFNNSNGCASADTLYLNISNGTPAAFTVTACGSYLWNGSSYTSGGDYLYSYGSGACNVTDTLHLTIRNGSYNSETASACNSYLWNGSSYTGSGTYIYPYNNSFGCPSVDTLFLSIYTGNFTSQSASACNSYLWNGSSYTASGDYVYNYFNANGCVSADTLHLTISNGSSASSVINSCGPYDWNGTTYNTDGVYFHSYNIGACSITDTLYLTVNTGTFTSLTENACQSYLWNGITYTATGDYVFNYLNASGCASADTLHLFVSTGVPVATTDTACGSYLWNGALITASGDYYYPYSVGACNVTDTLHITINQGTFNALTDAACQTYTWNGTTYSSSGNYIYNYLNGFGCASADTLHLTIDNGTPVGTAVSACDSYLWNGITYTSDGVYYHNYSAGTCNLTDTLYLNINSGTFLSQTEVACQSFSWNGSIYTSSGNYVFNYNNNFGCASADTLHLTINTGTPVGTTVSACGSYLWNGTTYTASGIYLYSYNIGVCQATDTLYLTIYQGDFNAFNETACESYLWNGITYTVSGTYVRDYLNGNGCASADTLHLTIHRGNFTGRVQNACRSYTWNNNTYTISGTYRHDYINSLGCPSSDTLYLNISPGLNLGPDKDLLICEGTTASLDGLYNLSGYSYQWTFDQNPVTNTGAISSPGPYRLIATDIGGCPDTVLVRLYVKPLPVANAGQDDISQTNAPYTLHGMGGISCSWTPPTPLNNANSCDPVAIISQNTQFILTVYDDLGCTDTDTVLISVLDGPAIYVPNAFTPNGDGLNDDFGPITVGFSRFEEFFIYNRYGQMVFYTTDSRRKWDGRFGGKPQDTGNFVWVVRVKDQSGKIVVRKGNVTLIR